MNINGVSAQSAQVNRSGLLNREERSLNGLSQEHLGNNEISQTQSTPKQPEVQENAKNETLKGVVRNLQEGHFKGVADVRLRINFFEELNTIENGEIQKLVGEKVPGVTDSVNANLEILLSSDELSEEQVTSISEHMETFTQSINLMKEDFLNTVQPSKENLISGLNYGFEEFITSVNLVLFPTEPESPDDISTNGDVGTGESINVNPVGGEYDKNIESDQAVESETNFQDFISNLRTTFAESLNEMTNALNNSKTLPDPSEPNGNGKAFDKFLAIYNKLQGIDAYDYSSIGSETIE